MGHIWRIKTISKIASLQNIKNIDLQLINDLKKANMIKYVLKYVLK